MNRVGQAGNVNDGIHADLTHQIINCALRVQNALGCGFLEKVYEAALAHELRKLGLQVDQQKPFLIRYDGTAVGEYLCDLLVADKVIVEIKAVKAFDDVHRAQCLNYLKATGLQVCLLINFGRPKLQVKRFISS